MITYIAEFFVLWFVAGFLCFPIKYINSKIMNTSKLSFTEDIILDSNGNRKKIDRGWPRVIMLLTLSGPVGLWVALGSLAASLYEYTEGTNGFGGPKLDYFKGDFDRFNFWPGPFLLFVYGPKATLKLISRML